MFVASAFALAGAQVLADYLTTGGLIGLSVGLGLLVMSLLGYLVYRQRIKFEQSRISGKRRDSALESNKALPEERVKQGAH